MAPKKHSKSLPFLIITAVIIALFIGYKILSEASKDAPVEEPVNDSVEMIIDRDPSEVVGLSYKIYGQEELSFAYNAAVSAWRLSDDSSFPLNQETVGHMAAAISSIGVFRTLETGDTGGYGFSNPTAEITVKYTNGDRFSYAVGDLNPATGNLYFKDLGTGSVYTISAGLLPYFEYELRDLFVYDKLPDDIQREYITSVVLTVGKDKKELKNADEIEKVFDLFNRLAPDDFLDWKTDDATKTKYGMGKAVLTINYRRAVEATDTSGATMSTRVAATYSVTFGETQKLSDGSATPYSVGTSGVIYRTPADTYSILNDILVAFGMSFKE